MFVWNQFDVLIDLDPDLYASNIVDPDCIQIRIHQIMWIRIHITGWNIPTFSCHIFLHTVVQVVFSI